MGRPEKWAKKRGANPDFSFFSWGIGSYMLLFRLAKSDGVEHSHKCPNSNDATFLIFADKLFVYQASIMAV